MIIHLTEIPTQTPEIPFYIKITRIPVNNSDKYQRGEAKNLSISSGKVD